jgi:hypothetical protein
MKSMPGSSLKRAAAVHVKRHWFLFLSLALALGAGLGVTAATSGIGQLSGKASGSATALPRSSHEWTGSCARAPLRRRYVSPTGTDANPGTVERPWATLGRALRTARPGDAMYLRTGTYPEWAVTTRNGTWTAPISLRAYPGERPVLTGRLKIASSYFCVTGLQLIGRTSANSSSTLIYVSGADHVEILRNEIRSSFVSGVYVGDQEAASEHVRIVRNYVANNGTNERLDHGLYLGHVDRALVANNLVVGNAALGIKAAPEVNRAVVTHNTVVRNGQSGVSVGGERSWFSKDNVVVNNIVAFNGAWGIRTYWEEVVGDDNLALANLVFGNRSGSFWFPRGGMVEQQSILADPLFVAPADYRLRLASPAVDQAVPAFSVRVDFTGRRRPSGSASDLGAYER